MWQEKEKGSREGNISVRIVLIVEDDAINALCLAQIIDQETPYRSFVAQNAFAALKFAQHLLPDLLILDYYLPDMDGITLYDHLHARRELQNIPAIILSASLDKCQQAILERKLIGLSKPFDLDMFLFQIEEALASRELINKVEDVLPTCN